MGKQVLYLTGESTYSQAGKMRSLAGFQESTLLLSFPFKSSPVSLTPAHAPKGQHCRLTHTNCCALCNKTSSKTLSHSRHLGPQALIIFQSLLWGTPLALGVGVVLKTWGWAAHGHFFSCILTSWGFDGWSFLLKALYESEDQNIFYVQQEFAPMNS